MVLNFTQEQLSIVPVTLLGKRKSLVSLNGRPLHTTRPVWLLLKKRVQCAQPLQTQPSPERLCVDVALEHGLRNWSVACCFMLLLRVQGQGCVV
mmetsp:Transcript_39173/g.63494  ORF Transcript_39173/g.63494 Transcript_39173/m.63494 type:complete len:94 (+) Transcript_39173:1146-1427(+)